MTALESAVRTNPSPLLLFAALKDFSGENISFLTKVHDWKRGWLLLTPTRTGLLKRPGTSEVNEQERQRQQFKCALGIYASCVSPKYSDYPVNLSHVHLKELETVFEGAAMAIYGQSDQECNSATPFDSVWQSFCEDVENHQSKDGIFVTPTRRTSPQSNSTDNILENDDCGKRQTILQTYEMTHLSDQLPECVPVPRGFGPGIFDRAEESIKYMVLTNTWPKFVNAGYASSVNRKKRFMEEIQSLFGSKKS